MLHHQENALIGALFHSKILIMSVCEHIGVLDIYILSSFVRYATCLVDLYKKGSIIYIDCTRERESNMGNCRPEETNVDRVEAEVDIDFRGLTISLSCSQ